MKRLVVLACVASLVFPDSPHAAEPDSCDDDSESLAIGRSAEVSARVKVKVEGCSKKTGCDFWLPLLGCLVDEVEVARLDLSSEADCTFVAGKAEGKIRATVEASVFTAPATGRLDCRVPPTLSSTVANEARRQAEEEGYECRSDAEPAMLPGGCVASIEALP